MTELERAVEWARCQVGKPYVTGRTSPDPALNVAIPSMTNFDHSIDDGLAEYLQAGGQGAQHFAVHFCGDLSYRDGLYVEEVHRFHEHVATLKAGSLETLMQIVNDEFGWQ